MEFKIGDKVALTYDGFSDLRAGEHFKVEGIDGAYLNVRRLKTDVRYAGIFPRRFKLMPNIRRR